MSPEIEEFRQRLVTHARLAISRAPKVDSEAKTNATLVQPFLTVLGYDVSNPDEVSPEHNADYSSKYPNKVDFAILHKGVPVIAIESKKLGAAKKDDLGQLRSYFHACESVKLGILTDGLRFDFYADSDKQNIMDEAAFLRVDLSEIAKSGAIDDNTLGGVAAIRSGLFNPEDVGAEAKRKLLFESIVETVKQFKADPSDDFIRFILGCPAVGGKIAKVTQKIVEANREVVKSAMEAFVAQEALARFGYAPKDLVKAPERAEAPAATQAVTAADEPEVDALVLTEKEIDVLSYIKNRLYYLVKQDALFNEVSSIAYRKTKTSFRVYYGRPNNGSLFDYREHRDGKIGLQFPALAGKEVTYQPSLELDECLIKSFTQRVADAGISLDSTVVLRSIKGGQAPGAA